MIKDIDIGVQEAIGIPPVMICGHSANSKVSIKGYKEKLWFCNICQNHLTLDSVNLIGRKAKCHCGKILDSHTVLKLFHYLPEAEFDIFYCGCNEGKNFWLDYICHLEDIYEDKAKRLYDYICRIKDNKDRNNDSYSFTFVEDFLKEIKEYNIYDLYNNEELEQALSQAVSFIGKSNLYNVLDISSTAGIMSILISKLSNKISNVISINTEFDLTLDNRLLAEIIGNKFLNINGVSQDIRIGQMLRFLISNIGMFNIIVTNGLVQNSDVSLDFWNYLNMISDPGIFIITDVKRPTVKPIFEEISNYFHTELIDLTDNIKDKSGIGLVYISYIL